VVDYAIDRGIVCEEANDAHLATALGTNQRIDLIGLRSRREGWFTRPRKEEGKKKKKKGGYIESTCITSS